ncbi:MAG: hypothetical protein ACWA5Q_06815, partial [bacterium]
MRLPNCRTATARHNRCTLAVYRRPGPKLVARALVTVKAHLLFQNLQIRCVKRFWCVIWLNLVLIPVVNAWQETSQLNPIVITATRDQAPLANRAVTIDVINDRRLQELSPKHVQQVLDTLPGVNFHRTDGQESLPSIRSPVLTGPG